MLEGSSNVAYKYLEAQKLGRNLELRTLSQDKVIAAMEEFWTKVRGSSSGRELLASFVGVNEFEV